MKSNRGISLISLAITIIIIILLAAITMNASFDSIDESLEAKFKNDLTSVVTALEIYNERAQVRGVSTYRREKLTWDGSNKYAENTAKMEDKEHVKEDTIRYILDGNPVPGTLDGIMTIESGEIKLDKTAKQEIEWATELYKKMGE